MIEGVSLHSLKQISVPKGDLWHAFKMNDEGFVGFGEAYLTQIEPHQIKGWKRHNRYVLNIVVIVVNMVVGGVLVVEGCSRGV